VDAAEPISVAPGVPDGDRTELERLAAWLDARTGLGGALRGTLRKVFPDHWSFLLGEIALFCFVILVLSGTFLAFFYVPSAARVVYEGPYEPLRGREVTAAFASVMDISLEVRAGLLFRQVHHWAAVVFVAVVTRFGAPARNADATDATGLAPTFISTRVKICSA